MKDYDEKRFLEFLLERFEIEQKKFDRSGVYAYTQRLLAYNSNKIEGSTLTEEQTASLFDHGVLPKTDDYYRAKDVEEMNGHFLMFNKMLDTLSEALTQSLIKQFHYELKSGVFEDRANGYAIGAYKERPNMIGIYPTTRPENVASEMTLLMDWYGSKKVDLVVLAEFHARYESIHPFQDGNGRTGRLIVFRECLKNRMIPIVIEDVNRNAYLDALKEYREKNSVSKLVELFGKEQKFYFEKCAYFM
ncbi:MAG: Fic family protein [Lachnospiraceae bacterium]|nr:Fic family protein [Lachnospiraceae bacterium]